MNEIIVKQRQFKESLVDLINKAELPAFILKPIFNELMQQIIQLEETQYQQALAIKEEKEKKENEKEEIREEEK